MWNEEKLKEELKLKSDEMLQIQERLKQLEDDIMITTRSIKGSRGGIGGENYVPQAGPHNLLVKYTIHREDGTSFSGELSTIYDMTPNLEISKYLQNEFETKSQVFKKIEEK